MWTLFEKQSGEWVKVKESPTGDRCKAVAKMMNTSYWNTSWGGIHRICKGKEFIIRDPAGRDWMKSVNSGSWRMKWEWM